MTLVLADIDARRRPAADALKDWGLVHRFAGSSDRAAIAGLVYDTLRRRASSAHIMGDQRPRATVLGVPANANSNQRFLTQESAREARFEVLGLLNEPSAAAVEFASMRQPKLLHPKPASDTSSDPIRLVSKSVILLPEFDEVESKSLLLVFR